jgi:acetoacetyl-CoA synthetase
MSTGMGDVLWTPDPDHVAATQVTRFRLEVNQQLDLGLDDHDALHNWSVADRPAFWRAMWEFAGVVGDGPGETVLVDGDRMPGASWFPESRLNYAENLLQGPDETEAIVFRGESGETRRLTFARLRESVAQVAAALAADGVGPGDRVVGFLPNIPEAVIAMLAATSLGAVWSSCSPDFGEQGVLDRFGQIEPKVLFTADGYSYGGKSHDSLATTVLILERLPSLVRAVVIPFRNQGSALAGSMVSWAEYHDPAAGPVPKYRRVPFNHPLFIMYSSGTTGLPKCMVHSVGGTLLQHLKEHQLHCDVKPGDRLFYFTTCGWMMWNWLVTGLASGATVMLFEGHPLQPKTALWDYAQEERFTILGTSARWIAACEKARLRPVASHDLSALRAILSTGSPLAPESFDYVYRDVKADVQLSSISGGTDIISCFALGSPVLPVRRGELQCRGLGMDVAVFDETGQAVTGQKGELVCRAPFPSMPVAFWNDDDGSLYHDAYFDRFEGIWCHGDFAELTPSGSMIIHGRSDTVLNPGGVRIGTAEIYRVVEQFDEVVGSLVVGLEDGSDVLIVLFVVLREGLELGQELKNDLRRRIREEKSPRHVPAFILQAPDIPRTISGKIVELAVRNILAGRPVDNVDALANPQALDFFRTLNLDLGRKQ